MNRAALILPYYGSFPEYFSLWLKSAEKNKEFDFLIFSDRENLYKLQLPANVYGYEMAMDQIKARLEKIAGRPVSLKHPYKLCDYKPLYGLVFEQYLKNYEFWGYCDPDVIWGRISNFITDEILDTHWRIYSLGHLTLYKNNAAMNQMYKNKINPLCTWEDVAQTEYCCHFDEMGEWNKYLEKKGIPIYNKQDFADIRCDAYRFRLVEGKKKDAKQIFEWKNGVLTRYYVDNDYVKEDEWLYIHLQKRDMHIEDKPEDHFVITPEKIINSNISIDIINRYSKNKLFWFARWKRRTKEIINNIRNGALKMRYIRFVRKLKHVD